MPAPNTLMNRVMSSSREKRGGGLANGEALYSPPGRCFSKMAYTISSIMAPKRNGISCMIGTKPIEAVTFTFGVNPVWATVIPVVKLATTPNSDEPSTMTITPPNTSPIIEACLIANEGRCIGSLELLLIHIW